MCSLRLHDLIGFEFLGCALSVVAHHDFTQEDKDVFAPVSLAVNRISGTSWCTSRDSLQKTIHAPPLLANCS